MHILIVEDDTDLAAAMAEYLELQGCLCDFSYTGESALAMASTMNFDLIILDLMLPKLNGISVCQQLRQRGKQTPILMLTATDSGEEQLLGFRAGIDDYVVKPCSMPLLWARLQAIYRRQNPPQDIIEVDELHLNLAKRCATRAGLRINLTPTGWKLLELLARRSPALVSRAELERAGWPDIEVSDSNFNVQLHQLRKALDKPFGYPLIHTRIGMGLCLCKENPEQCK